MTIITTNGQKKPLLRIKKKRVQELLQLLGMKKGKTVVDGINKKNVKTIWDERREREFLLGINKRRNIVIAKK